jgi:hypothetical protein
LFSPALHSGPSYLRRSLHGRQLRCVRRQLGHHLRDLQARF